MEALHIAGPVRLSGEVTMSGAKNAALPIMAASILADGPVMLDGVPNVTDVHTHSEVLAALGVLCHRHPDGTLCLETVDAELCRAPRGPVRRMRAGFCVLGPLLARRGRAVVPLPGGCRIGERPVDLHLKGLAALGAEIRVSGDYVVARARRLRGTTVNLLGPYGPTVTGTANVMSAAALARGVTTIHGAAVEPEIVDLGRFLQSLGARLDGLGTRTVMIRGVTQLGAARYRIVSDRIEAATFLIAAAITGGAVTVNGPEAHHLQAVLDVLRRMGCEVEIGTGQITLRCDGRLRSVDAAARPFPGVPTDVQPQLTALLTQAEGRGRVSDCVFPERFTHLAPLQRLGARIAVQGASAVVAGPAPLHAATVRALDLRGGAALVLAALAADGPSVIHGVHHIDRGYDRLVERLRALGADVRRISPRATTANLPHAHSVERSAVMVPTA